ncbi:GNAT family N-acetyltransferase [Microbacterium halotolerans]|uniref:GNAT family N-acetyltransferase n=1 Tax=Microbacterium halotolerans TaxID=246613 RepID=UPI000E6AB8A2|nr:GNAT family N-acetyltransferase [Microbacterium halotolerans]
MEKLQISVGFTEQERDRVGLLYWEAFRDKLRPAFTDDETGLRVVRSSMRADRILVARIEGEVAGVCGFHERGVGAVDLSWSSLRTHVSAWRAVRAVVVLSILERSEKNGRLVLDGICVDATRRGAGIGSALLDAAADYAQESGATAVHLSVIDRNPRAAALYRRRGFEPVGGGSLGILGYLYGFDRYIAMERPVSR